MTWQTVAWQCRWIFDKRWKAATIARYRRESWAAEKESKPFRMTALRRFVMGRVG